MRLYDTVAIALRAVAANRSRALLTMLGIIIGVGAVTLMTSVGRSMQSVILGQISALGPKTIALWPGQQGPEGGGVNTEFDALKISDADAVKRLTTVSHVAPMMFITSKTSYGKETSDTRIVGTTPEYYANQTVDVTEGRLHDAQDEAQGRSVAVLGPDTARDLFGNRNPIGKRISVGNNTFTVIGVLESVGSQFFQNLDERIIVPFSTARTIAQHDYVDMVTMQAEGDIDNAIDDLSTLLRRRHKIISDDDFLIRSAAQAQEILSKVSLGLTFFITLIAAVSLVVGGIGIMNIMLVAVTERTREIGLRKALGAHRRDILLQFLLEAVVLTFLGGIIGMLLGLGLNAIIVGIARNFLDRYIFALSPIAMIAALLMAAGTGLVFGIYPARKAAALNPIEALRYE